MTSLDTLDYAINQLVEKKGFKLSGEKGKIRELASDEDHKVVSIEIMIDMRSFILLTIELHQQFPELDY